MKDSALRYMKSYPNVKLNIGLNVLRRRADGFHDIETLFVPCCAFHDTLEIVPSDRLRFVADVPWNNDLTMQAYGLLKAEFDIPPVEIRLTKGSPVGAGLGGGSADAAFALRSLNDLFSLGLDDAALAARAARLGSDCAFVIYNRPMLGSGRGEILEPFDVPLEKFEIRVEVPEGVSVSTAEAYRGITPSVPQIRLREALGRPVEDWKDLVRNDFEDTVFALHPEIAALKRRLYDEGALYASMSGSGSSVFGIFSR